MIPPKTILAVLLLLALAAPAAAQYQPWEGSSVVQDPEWRKHFLGSYGFLSGAEPDVRPDELLVLREVIELMQVNLEAAATMLQQQATADSSATFDFVLANLEFQNGNLDSAEKYYRSALKKFPDFRRAHKNLGLLLVQQSRFEPALEHLSRAVELGDRDGRNYGLIGYSYINREKYLEASIAYRNAILQEPDTRDWKLGLARSLMAMEHYKDAVGLFQGLLEDDPDDSTIWMLQANAYLGLERPQAAAVNLEAVRAMGKAQNSSLVLLGDIYMNAGMPELAADAYVEVIEADEGGTEFETAYRAADLLIRTRAFQEADGILDTIERRYSALPQEDELRVLTLKAKVARARGAEKEAAEVLESIVERDGTRGDALLELASYYQGRGDNARALFLIERAQNIEAFEYQALLAHAQLKVSEKSYREAAQLLRKALRIRSEPRVESFLARVEEASRR